MRIILWAVLTVGAVVAVLNERLSAGWFTLGILLVIVSVVGLMVRAAFRPREY